MLKEAKEVVVVQMCSSIVKQGIEKNTIYTKIVNVSCVKERT